MKLVYIGAAILAATTTMSSAQEIPKTAAEMGIMQGSPPLRTINIAEWDKGPDNRWAFQHISEIIPVANISRGSGQATSLQVTPKDISGLEFKAQDGAEMSVQDMLTQTYTDGFIVLHEGDVVYEKYFNAMTPSTR